MACAGASTGERKRDNPHYETSSFYRAGGRAKPQMDIFSSATTGFTSPARRGVAIGSFPTRAYRVRLSWDGYRGAGVARALIIKRRIRGKGQRNRETPNFSRPTSAARARR